MNAAGKRVTGWAGAASIITSADGSSSVVGPVPVENGTTGLGWMDFTAEQMSTTCVNGCASIINLGAQDLPFAVFTTEPALDSDDGGSGGGTGVYDPIVGQQIERLYERFISKGKLSDGSEFRLLDDDGVTVIARAPTSFDNGVNYLGPLVYVEDEVG